MQIVLIKLGGSIVTNKSQPLSFQKDTVSRIGKELERIIKNNPDTKFILGNGAGSFGHYMAHKTNYKKHSDNLDVANQVALSVLKLNSLVVKTLQESGINAIGIQPSAFLQRKPNLAGDVPGLKKMLMGGAVPVFYGDVVRDGQSGTSIASTEDILMHVAVQLKNEGLTISKLLLATNVDGVLDLAGKTIKKLSVRDQQSFIGSGDGYDVTGGMLQKVQRGFEALTLCDDIRIISGSVPGTLGKALSGESVGTKLVN